MAYVRLGDRIEVPYYDPVTQFDVVAQRVFNTYIHQSSDELARAYRPPTGLEGERFEQEIRSKLLCPARPVLAIVGPMGSGKTTSMAKLGLMDIAERPHDCGAECSLRVRLIGKVDFNQYPELQEADPEEAGRLLLELVNGELRSTLKVANVISEEREYGSFWSAEILRFQAAADRSKAFRKLIPGLQQTDPVQEDMITAQQIKSRRTLLQDLEPSEQFDYLIRLWEFALREVYHGSHGCAFIVFDNVDYISPAAQHRLVELVHAHARIAGPQFILLVRPEAFAHVGLATGAVDVVTQCGPSPLDVLMHRLSMFVRNPDHFIRASDEVTEDQKATLNSYLSRVYNTIRRDIHESVQDFVSAASGCSIRAAMLIGQGLFHVSETMMKKVVADSEGLTGHDIVRELLRRGDSQFRWTSRSVYEHLLRVESHGVGPTLTKMRLLSLAGRHPNGIRISEAANTLAGFGYDRALVSEAINELMTLNSQLLRSDGSDHYGTASSVDDYNGDHVRITAIGEGYLAVLSRSQSYLEEIMLDTIVDGDRFPETPAFGYVHEKVRLLRQFLAELLHVDSVETEGFVSRWRLATYHEQFGTQLESVRMIQGVYPSVRRLLRSRIDSQDEMSPIYHQLLRDYADLCIRAEGVNDEMLSYRVRSVVEDDDVS